MPGTPARLRAEAARLRARPATGEERLSLDHTALLLEAVAAEWERDGLHSGERSANIQPVTHVEARRGRAIAKSRLDEREERKGKDKIRTALVAKWGSQARAAKALGVSTASLVAYLDGVTACPRRVAFRAQREADVAPTLWPGGLAD